MSWETGLRRWPEGSPNGQARAARRTIGERTKLEGKRVKKITMFSIAISFK